MYRCDTLPSTRASYDMGCWWDMCVCVWCHCVWCLCSDNCVCGSYICYDMGWWWDILIHLCAAVCCTVTPLSVCCSVLQCVAVCCRVCSVLQCVLQWCCSVLKCLAACCSVGETRLIHLCICHTRVYMPHTYVYMPHAYVYMPHAYVYMPHTIQINICLFDIDFFIRNVYIYRIWSVYCLNVWCPCTWHLSVVCCSVCCSGVAVLVRHDSFIYVTSISCDDQICVMFLWFRQW